MGKITIVNKIKPQTNSLGVKIEASFLAYSSFQKEMMFWESDNSCYCLWGDNMSISGEVDADFVRFVSPKTVLCSKENADILNLKILQCGEVMSKNINGEKKEIPKMYFDKLKEVYNLFVSVNMDLDYEGFLLDTSHKLRNSLASISCIYEGEKLVATALCPYITEKFALISAVAVLPEYQNKLYGKKVLEDLEQQLSGRKVYLLKEKGENDIFYKKQNYNPEDFWVLGEI